MLKRDFIMVQIEEIGKMVVQLVLNRNDGNDGNDGNPAQSEDVLATIYKSLQTTTDFLLTHSPAEIREQLNLDDGCGLERAELAAKTLIEESYRREDPLPLRRKARELIEFVQANDNTFSLERMQLLQELND